MNTTTHALAVRIYGGPLKLDKITTPNGKEYTLLNLPFYLAGRIETYIDWLFELQ